MPFVRAPSRVYTMSYLPEVYRPPIIQKSLINLTDRNYYPDEINYLDDFPIEWEQNRYILENSQFVEALPEEAKRQSIFESYDPINDAERLQKLSHLSPELQKYYVKENLLSYFEEFAAEIRIKKLSGVIKDTGEMEILGTNVTDMYNHSAELAGLGSREDRERNGLNQIISGILAGNNRVIWTSPPKLADYGFVFTFIAEEHDEKLGGRPFRELLLRYDEPFDSIERSREIYNTIKERTGTPAADSDSLQTADDFLDNPLVYAHTQYEDLHDLYKLLDITGQDAEKSELFRRKLEPYIEPMMEEYTSLLRQLSQYELSTRSEQITMLEDQCKVLIGGMFNTARIVNRTFESDMKSAEDQEVEQELLQHLAQPMESRDRMYDYAQQLAHYEELTITGGTNCPVTRAAGNTELQFLQSLSEGFDWIWSSQVTGLPNSLSSEKNWKFDKTGVCRACGGGHESVGLLGPCLVCRKCQKEFDAKEQIEKMIQSLTGRTDIMTME